MAEMSARSSGFSDGFRVGRVFSRSFEIMSKNFGTFFLTAAVATLPLLLVYGSLYGQRLGRPNFGLIGFSGFLTMFLYTICQAVILYAAFQYMRGRPINLGESIRIGLSRFPAIIGVSFCVTIAIMIGMIFLLVPGFILMAMLAVALPVCVVEKLGPFQSMGRSSDLTKGHRWKVFGILLVIGLINVVIGGLLQAIVTAVGGGIVGVIGLFLWRALIAAFQAVIVVVAYHDLRVAKEGIDVEQIASVFD